MNHKIDPLPPINVWALGQGTYNASKAAIYALTQFDRQDAPGTKGNLIIVDSSPDPSEATAFYEKVTPTRPDVFYFHMPFRPGHEKVLDTDRFPHAYRWMTDPYFNAIYKATIPNDKQLVERYISETDIKDTLRSYGPKAFAEMIQTVMPSFSGSEDVSKAAWNAAVNKFAEQGKFHDRPHLGSKRNFIDAVAQGLNAQAVVNLDDDYIKPQYVNSQLDALRGSHMTGKMGYVTLIYTNAAMESGTPPIWATTDLHNPGSDSYFLNHHGVRIEGREPSRQNSMGWSQARRLGGPKVPDILYGEDRAYEARVNETGHRKSYMQTHHCDEPIRLVFGTSSSDNLVSGLISPDSYRMPSPPLRDEICAYTRALCGRGELPTTPEAPGLTVAAPIKGYG